MALRRWKLRWLSRSVQSGGMYARVVRWPSLTTGRAARSSLQISLCPQTPSGGWKNRTISSNVDKGLGPSWNVPDWTKKNLGPSRWQIMTGGGFDRLFVRSVAFISCFSISCASRMIQIFSLSPFDGVTCPKILSAHSRAARLDIE